MTFIDRLFVFMASLFAGLFLFSITGFEAAMAIPACGLVYAAWGGKWK